LIGFIISDNFFLIIKSCPLGNLAERDTVMLSAKYYR